MADPLAYDGRDMQPDTPPTPAARRPVALVTGGSRGIGRAIALELAAAGHDVAVTARSASAAQPVADTIRGAHPAARALAVDLDVTAGESVRAAVARVEAELGPIAVLVNNAGIQRLGTVLEQTEADWDAVHATDLRGPFLVAQAVARRMVARRAGVIVNIASAAGIVPFTGRAAYAAAKAGLIMLTRTLAHELAPHGIRANAVAPTFVETELGRLTLDQPGAREALAARIPLGRVATVEEVAVAVRYLVSAEASFITGTVLPVDGGISMR